MFLNPKPETSSSNMYLNLNAFVVKRRFPLRNLFPLRRQTAISPTWRRRGNRFQILNLKICFHFVVKWRFRLKSVSGFPFVVKRWVRHLTTKGNQVSDLETENLFPFVFSRFRLKPVSPSSSKHDSSGFRCWIWKSVSFLSSTGEFA